MQIFSNYKDLQYFSMLVCRYYALSSNGSKTHLRRVSFHKDSIEKPQGHRTLHRSKCDHLVSLLDILFNRRNRNVDAVLNQDQLSQYL